MNSPRIIVVALSCHPDRGSEPGMSWNIIKHLCRRVGRLTVITADYHHSSDRVREEARRLSLPADFHFVPLPDAPSYLRGPLVYLLFERWHCQAARRLRELLSADRYDVVHLLNTVGYRLSGYCHRVATELGVPYVWGPIDGASSFPLGQAAGYIGWRGCAYYVMYNVLNYLQFRYSPSFRAALRNTSRVLAASTDMRELLRSVHGKDADRVAEVGCDFAPPPPRPAVGDTLEVAWSGLHIFRKALPVLLHALRVMPPDYRRRVRVQVLGEGPLTPRWQRCAERLGVSDRLTWHGWKPKPEALERMARCHVLCQTSFREATSTVIMEAFSLGMPVICFRCCGMKDVVTPRNGWLLEVARGAHGQLAQVLCSILDQPRLLEQRSAVLRKTLSDFSWERSADAIARAYGQVMATAGRPRQSIRASAGPPVACGR